MLVILRSVVFNVLFYLNLLVHFIVAIPTLVMPRMAIVKVAMFWGRTNNWLLRAVCGIKVEYRGLEKIPPGALLVASKHQSLWETFALLWLFSDPAFILKRELQWIPFFGWYAWKAGMIPVDRGAARAGAGRHDRARARRARARPPDRDLSRRHAARARRRAELQIRHRASLRRDRHAVPADRAQFRAVLAAPVVPALSRHDRRRDPRSDSARPRARTNSRRGCSRISRPRPRG